MQRIKWDIDQQLLKDMGINPNVGIEYLEQKKAVTIDPVHVMAHQLLKKKPQPMIGSNS